MVASDGALTTCDHNSHAVSYLGNRRFSGSTPAASTNFFLWNQAVTLPVPAASRLLPTLEVCPDSNNLIAASSAAGLKCM